MLLFNRGRGPPPGDVGVYVCFLSGNMSITLVEDWKKKKKRNKTQKSLFNIKFSKLMKSWDENFKKKIKVNVLSEKKMQSYSYNYQLV